MKTGSFTEPVFLREVFIRASAPPPCPALLREQHRAREQPDNETLRIRDQRLLARRIRVEVFRRQVKQLQHDLRADFVDSLARERRHPFQLHDIVRHFRRHVVKVRAHRFT